MSLSDSQTPANALYGSWADLEELITEPQDSVSFEDSVSPGELEGILLVAQLESDSPPQTETPPMSESPQPANEHDSQCVTIQEEVEQRVDAEWVWDWSSRPENMPPKEFVFHHPQQGSLSVRKTEVRKRGILFSDLLLIFVPSLLVSHLLTLGVGIFIGKRLAASTTSIL